MQLAVAGRTFHARSFAVLLALSLLGLPLVAQSAPQEAQVSGSGPRLTVTSQIVVLDVVVTDKKGNLVTRPLTKDDFTVYDAGVQQSIRHFEVPAEHKMPDPGKDIVESAADLKKIGDAPVTILVLDELNSRFEDMSYSRQMMVKYLQSQPAILPNPAVLMVASNTTFQQIHDYTQNRDELIQVVKKHMPEFPYKATSNTGPGAVERMAQVLNALQEIAQSSTGTPGRKNVIWVGNGFPSADLVGMEDSEAAQIEAAIRRSTARLLAARITLYSIDPRPGETTTIGLVDSDDPGDIAMGMDSAGDPFGDGAVSFSNFGPSTGGIAFRGRNDINNIIGESINKGAEYYTLSYYPTNIVDPKVYRNIKIIMKDPNLRATTREGYYPASNTDTNPVLDKTLTPKEVRANLQLDLSNALTTTISYNGLGVTAEKGSGNEYVLHVAESGIGWSTPDTSGKSQTEATVAAGWYDAKGKLIGHTARELVFPRGETMGAEYKITADAPPAAKRIRFVVRDAYNGHLGTADICPGATGPCPAGVKAGKK